MSVIVPVRMAEVVGKSLRLAFSYVVGEVKNFFWTGFGWIR